MKSNTMVTGFGIVSVCAAVLILVIGSREDTGTPQTPAEHGKRLFRVQGCSSCHAIGGGVSRGPDLTGLMPRLEERLSDASYRSHLKTLRESREDVYEIFTDDYVEILNTPAGEARIRVWLHAHFKNPRFDHFMGRMPTFAHLTQQQVEQLTEFLFTLR